MPQSAPCITHKSHLHTQVDQSHLGQLDRVDEAGQARVLSTNTSHSVYVQIVALSLCEFHLRKRHIENILPTQSTGLHLDKDVFSQIIPIRSTCRLRTVGYTFPGVSRLHTR